MQRTFALIRTSSLVTLAASLGLVAGCATRETAAEASTVTRSRAPVDYERAIGDYFSFRIPGSHKNRELSFGKPQPGGCPLGLHRSSQRGWVVPVVYVTRTGVPTGREAINITAKEHFFWFSGETIAGITPRIELCP
jgi:hypothetical protein